MFDEFNKENALKSAKLQGYTGLVLLFISLLTFVVALLMLDDIQEDNRYFMYAFFALTTAVVGAAFWMSANNVWSEAED